MVVKKGIVLEEAAGNCLGATSGPVSADERQAQFEKHSIPAQQHFHIRVPSLRAP